MQRWMVMGMDRCKDCIHFGICKKGFPWADGKGGGWCEDFKSKADCVEVVRGYNIDQDTPSLFECSVCHWCCTDTYYGDTADYNYCPHCGAKMDGDGNG